MTDQSQRIKLDFNNVLRVGAEHGLTEQELDAATEQLRQAIQAVQQRRQGGDLRWMELPYADTGEIEQLAADLRDQFENFVVLGIGGSALGNIAVNTALNGPFYNQLTGRKTPRLFVLDNSDPEFNAGLLDVIDPAKSVFNVITKSGSTGETLSSFLFFRDAVQKAVGADKIKDHFVLTTDPAKGPLRELVNQEGFRSLPVPDGVGGRFSVLSPVGLLSAAVTGIDIKQLLAGAAYADELTREADPWQNPAALGALIQYLLYGKGVDIVVMMPYAQRLKDVADWFAQLWAESLGKKLSRTGETVNVGPTPVKALGATDQHSQVQLYVEGPFNKLINFIRVEQFAEQGALPAGYADMDAFAYLTGHSFAELINAEQEATAIALTEAGKPSMTHIVPEINAFTVGQLLYLLEVQTAIAGELFGIDAFDQPGVEAGKIATYALLGRSGYEQQRQQIEQALGQNNPRAVV
ncbi:MAG: glucose-6-phosphate isomerase [Chloroflexi bacterium]|nr:glucose-6-phosphate isomerase [Chloroflexota bacterium]